MNTTSTEGAYLVGLPVIVTIGSDGRITLDVCAEDLAEALREEDATDAHVALVESFPALGTQFAAAR